MITRIIVHQRNHESLPRVDLLVPWMHQDPSDLGIIGPDPDHPKGTHYPRQQLIDQI